MNDHLLLRVFQVLTGVLLGAACVLFVLNGRSGPDPDGREASYFLPEPLPAPEFVLTSHLGDPVGPSSFPGKVLVVFFGYTSCPDVCPLTLSHLGRAFQRMGEEGERIQVLFITVDPQRDTPERLGEYLSSFHPSFLGLTGTEAEIREVADGFGVFFARSGGAGANYTVDHTARTFVLDRTGRIILTFPVTASTDEIVRDLETTLKRSP